MSEPTVRIRLDGQEIDMPEHLTVMQAADRVGVHIPRLCHHPSLSIAGACRVCIVDVAGVDHYMASCSLRVTDGLDVTTSSPQLRQARRDIVELLLDNHSWDCQTCTRDGQCELQNLAYSLGVRERLFAGQRKDVPDDRSSLSVIRTPDKCILCGRCVRVCSEVQAVGNLGRQGRGFGTVVSPAHGVAMDESVCIQCGQCINVCPTAAFLEQSATEAVWAALANPEKHVVVQTAPSIRAAIGEGFGLAPGTPSTEKMVAALRRLGFARVFDTDFGADMTIVEEANELIERLDSGGPLPILTSCSPGWVSFMETFYPELIPHASTCRSPMTMVSVLAKTYYAQQIGVDPAKIFMVAVMPCVAKKYEAGRAELRTAAGQPLTDAVLTTRELIWMIHSWGIDYWTMPDIEFWNLPDDQFDDPLGVSSGAGDIFGVTGGVMEATLRTAAERLSGDTQGPIDFAQVRDCHGVTEAEIDVGGRVLRVAVADGLHNARTVLDRILNKQRQYDIVEVMACPGGCIGGGGQPYPPKNMYPMDPELLARRTLALRSEDRRKELRRSHENPSILKLYREFLGSPGSAVARRLLHTTYQPRRQRGVR